MLLHYELRLLRTVPALNVTPLGSGLFRPQPARGRHHRHLAEPSRRRRADAYQADINGQGPPHMLTERPSRFSLVDFDSGEIKDS